MIKRINRKIQDYLRKKRLFIGKLIWDNKKEKSDEKIIENDSLNMEKVKSILFLRDDGKIGDMIVNTLMFKEIKNRYPTIKIGVVTRKISKDIIKYNRNIDVIYVYEKGKEKELAKKIAEENYDILVDFSEVLRVRQMKLINLCKAKVNIGLNKENWKLFEISYKKDDGKHISNLYEKVLKIFKIEDIEVKYEINVPKESTERVNKMVENCEKIVVLNPFAASKHRSLNEENIKKIAEKLLKDKGGTLFIIGESEKEEEIKRIIKKIDGDVRYPKLKNILDVVALISKSSYVVTPDTSIVHIAATFRIPMTAIYRLDRGSDTNSKIWAPNYEEAKQIFSIDKEKSFGEESDINFFNIDEI